MTIIMLCSEQGNQKALANRINDKVRLDALVVFKFSGKRLPILNKFIDKISRALNALCTFFIYRKIWFGMVGYYEKKFPQFPIAPSITTSDINDPEVVEFIVKLKPSLVVVSGTNLLKEPLIEAIQKTGEVVNLHTGISPFVKGGPNCTNWCLYTGNFDLIGNTIMWLDRGIDSGCIIATERTSLNGRESLLRLHLKVMDHAHDLYVRAIFKYVSGESLPKISQNSLGIGVLYFGKQWKLKQMIVGLINFYLYFRHSNLHFNSRDDFKLVSLEESNDQS